jgi:branched-chain amino acid transport system permease protein
MEFFIQQLINGLTLGGIYALIALGYTMVYGIIQLINFAHGEFFAAGGYMGVILLSFLASQGYLETHPWLCLGGSMALSMMYCSFLAMGVEKVAYKPLRQASRLSVLLSALGMSIFLQNGLMLTQGVYDKPYPTSFTQGGFDFGMITVSYLQLIIIFVTICLLIVLNALVFKTRMGKAMRATAQDKVMAALVGINSNRIISITFAIGAALAAAAGVMVGLYYGSVRYDMGFVPGIKAFAAAVLGGIGNITGAMLGGLIIGMVEILAAGYVSGQYKDVFAFIILILVLYVRPTGIMGENVDETRV